MSDFQTLADAFAAAQGRLDAAGNARVLLPPGRVMVSGSPSLRVPAGGSLTVQGRATELYVTDGGNGLTVSVAPGTGPRVSSARSLVRDVQFTKADGAVGGAGLKVVGSTLSAGDLYATEDDISCLDAPDATAGWTSCLELVNTTGSHSHIRATFPQSPQAQPGHGALIALSSTGAMASLDNTFSDVALFGGFAEFTMKGHVEGVYVTGFHAVGSNYGVYWPHSKSAVPADSGLLLTMSNGHFNTTTRGVYTDRVGSVMLSQMLFYSTAAGQPQEAGSVLPQDDTPWHGGAANWAAVDIQNAGNWTLSGAQIYGGATPGSQVAYAGVVVDDGGCGERCARGEEQPGTIIGTHFVALSRCAVWLAPGLGRVSLVGNSSEVTAGLCANGNQTTESGNDWDNPRK